LVGSHFVHEMHRAAQQAARTVAVLSAAYLTSAYAEAEWQAAWIADPSGRDRKLLVGRVGDCPRPGLLGQLVGVGLLGRVPQEDNQRLLAAVAGGRASQSVNRPSRAVVTPPMAEGNRHSPARSRLLTRSGSQAGRRFPVLPRLTPPGRRFSKVATR